MQVMFSQERKWMLVCFQSVSISHTMETSGILFNDGMITIITFSPPGVMTGHKCSGNNII